MRIFTLLINVSLAVLFSNIPMYGAQMSQQDEQRVAAAPVTAGNSTWSIARDLMLEKAECVGSFAYSPDAQYLVMGFNDGVVKVWDLKNGKVKYTLEGHAESVQFIMYRSNGASIVTVSENGTVMIWNAQTGQKESQLDTHVRNGLVAGSPDGRLFVGMVDEHTIKVWDLKTKAEKLTLDIGDHVCGPIVFSPDRQYLAVGCSDRNGCFVRIANLSNNKWDRTLNGPEGLFNWISYSPDGTYLIALYQDNIIATWNVRREKLERRFVVAQRDRITSPIVHSPNGEYIAVGSRGGVVTIWSMKKGEKRDLSVQDAGSIFSIAFSPDGEHLAASNANIMTIWNVESGTQEARWCWDQPLRSYVPIARDLIHRKYLANKNNPVDEKNLVVVAGFGDSSMTECFSRMTIWKTLTSSSVGVEKSVEERSLVEKKELQEVSAAKEERLPIPSDQQRLREREEQENRQRDFVQERARLQEKIANGARERDNLRRALEKLRDKQQRDHEQMQHDFAQEKARLQGQLERALQEQARLREAFAKLYDKQKKDQEEHEAVASVFKSESKEREKTESALKAQLKEREEAEDAIKARLEDQTKKAAERREKLNKEIEELTRRLAESRDQQERMQKEREVERNNFDQERARLQAQQDQMREQIKRARPELLKLQQDLERERGVFKAERAQLQARLAGATGEQEPLREQLRGSRDEGQRLQAERDQIQPDFDQAAVRFQRQIAELTRGQERLQGQLRQKQLAEEPGQPVQEQPGQEEPGRPGR